MVNATQVILFSSVSSTGLSKSIDLQKEYNYPSHAILEKFTILTIFGGIATAATIEIEGSIEGANWFDIAIHEYSAEELANGEAMFHIYDKPIKNIRSRLTELNGTSPTATVSVLGLP